MKRRTESIVAGACALAFASVASAQVVVWVDFTSDLHNGLAGGANGTPDWVDELSKLTTSAGVTPFSGAEIALLEAEILSQLATIYSGYTISFTTTLPGAGTFDAIAFGKNSFGYSPLGDAPSDYGNIATSQVGSVATGNFDFILDEFTGSTDRPEQIRQLATALAGTGAHEIGHTLGLFHHHAYGTTLITPANYAATGSAQNLHIMATGPTGISELQRESIRGHNQWERAMMDIAGGASAYYPTFDNKKMVPSPVTILMGEVGPMDAGSTPMSAMTVALTPGATSGMKLAFIAADLDGSPGDMDWFKFLVTEPSYLTAEIVSTLRFASPFHFDAIISLLTIGGAPIVSSDNVNYDDDVFGSGTLHSLDPFLLNIPLAPGEYILSVSASPTPGAPPAPGDAYWLVIGTSPIPEPSFLGALMLPPLMLARRRRTDSRD